MESVKSHFENEAKEFDGIILRLIPHYAEMIEGMVASIPFGKTDRINVIDLGCGTGTISKKIKEKFPKAKITCLDLAENMVEMSKLKLSCFSDIRYQIDDFNHYEFDDTYDVVVSSLALHHLITDEDKVEFYRRVYKSLRPSGVFYNADIILGASDNLQKTYMNKWKDFMKKNVSEEEVESKWLPKYREEDRPAKLMDQMTWLVELGFVNADVIWKYYNFAVYGAQKPPIT